MSAPSAYAETVLVDLANIGGVVDMRGFDKRALGSLERRDLVRLDRNLLTARLTDAGRAYVANLDRVAGRPAWSMATPRLERVACGDCGHFHRRVLRTRCTCCAADFQDVYGQDDPTEDQNDDEEVEA